MRLTNRVLARRQELGLSQHELSRRTGLSRITIRWIERNDGYTPSSTVMLKLSEALGREMNELFWSEQITAGVA